MSRDIKFRAWSHVAKKMYEVTSLDFYTTGVTDIAVKTGQSPNGIMYSAVCEPDGLTIMQFTGLLDKNGKEIYDGDILSWRGLRGEVFWDEEFASWRARKIGSLGGIPDLEIIGNSYENFGLILD